MKRIHKILIIVFSLLLLMVLLYLSFFNRLEPSVKKTKTYTADVQKWNIDGDIHSIEWSLIYIDETQKAYFESPFYLRNSQGIIYRKAFRDTRKYVIKPGLDSLIVATDMSGHIIKLWNRYQYDPSEDILKEIDQFGKWLLAHSSSRDSISVWTYPFKFTKYDLDYDWTGAWAMGNILSALARCYQLSDDPKYLQTGKRAVKAFHTSIEDGGIASWNENGRLWFEEYPTVPANHVLNGHINGIMGLYDFWRVTGNTLAGELYQEGIKTVREELYKYDLGYWSRYDQLYPYAADYFYHNMIHIPQLKLLAELSRDSYFLDMAQRWLTYDSNPQYTMYKFHMFRDAVSRRLKYKSIKTIGRVK